MAFSQTLRNFRTASSVHSAPANDFKVVVSLSRLVFIVYYRMSPMQISYLTNQSLQDIIDNL